MLDTLFSSEVIKKIFSIIRDSGEDIRFVGGCVRNAIINIPVQDTDLATTCLPGDVELLLAKHHIKTINIGKDFGTIIAVVGKESYEITTLRKDVEFYNGRHAVVEHTTDWREDAARRDFTFNAMSYCPYQDKLFDYFSGREDLSKGLVRFIGRAEDRVKEDYLRILRFFRFYACYGESFDQDSFNACIKNSKHLSLISAERKWQELSKILSSERYIDVLELMINNGVLDDVVTFHVSKDIIPALKLINSKLQSFSHAYTAVFILFILAYLSGASVQVLKKALSLSNKEMRYLSSIYACIEEIQDRDIEDSLYLYVFKWKDILLDALIITYASKSSNKLRGGVFQIKDIIEHNQMIFPVSGHDIMQNFEIKESNKQIGVLLEIGKKYWCNTGFSATKNEIIEYIKNYG